MQPFDYHIHWRAQGVRSGGHATRHRGGCQDFLEYVPFMRQRDPHRIDLRATLRTAPQTLMVRAYSERSAIPVYAVVDASTSMRFSGQKSKWQLLTQIVGSIASSATRNGDMFGMVVCDTQIREELSIHPVRRISIAHEAQQKLDQHTPQAGVDASALPEVVSRLPKQKSLIFLLSDFYWDATLLTQTLQSLSPHDVIPVVLWNTEEYQALPNWGWMRVENMENKGKHSLFLRPALHAKILKAFEQRRFEIKRLCRKHGTRPPFFVSSEYGAEHMTRHLLEAT